jgi:hypothetical protein
MEFELLNEIEKELNALAEQSEQIVIEFRRSNDEKLTGCFRPLNMI